jgi:ribosome-associated protein
VSSKVVLTFDVQRSGGLSDEEKELLKVNLSSRLTTDFVLILNCDEDRQFRNKEIVTKRFLEVIKSWRCRKLEKQQNPLNQRYESE